MNTIVPEITKQSSVVNAIPKLGCINIQSILKNDNKVNTNTCDK